MTVIAANPAGESKNTDSYPPGSWPLDTPGGRYYAEWDDQAPVTREGQLIIFFQFLHAGGRWEEFLRGCPLLYTGNRGSGALNVMGTVLLSMLSGHWRYAHINALRGDGINPGLLGMSGTVSEDTVPAVFTASETLDFGVDLGSLVSRDYAAADRWIFSLPKEEQAGTRDFIKTGGR